MAATGGWGCPHDGNGECAKRLKPCEPGEEGCVLEERMKKPEQSRIDAKAREK